MLTFFGCSSQRENKTKKDKKIPPHIRELTHLTVYKAMGKVDTTFLKKTGNYPKHYLLHGIFIPPITVDDANRVFMLNKPQLGIDVYDSKGTFVTRLGRKGRGPGEFHEIKWMQVLDNRLYIYDGRLKQFQVFTLHPLSYATTLQSIPKNLHRFPNLPFIDHNPVYVISDSTYLYRFENMSKLSDGKKFIMGKGANLSINYYLMNRNRHLRSDTVLHQKGRQVINTKVNGTKVTLISFPFTRKSLVAISRNKRIYTARTQDFLIKVYNLKGKYLRAFYYPYKRAPLTDSQTDSVIKTNNHFMQAAMRQVRGRMPLPATWPALHSMEIDDQNRLWVSTIVKNTQIYQWWVMNDKGKLLARFRWPRDWPVKAIRNGYLYAIKSNHKQGTYQVIKYKIQFRKNK